MDLPEKYGSISSVLEHYTAEAGKAQGVSRFLGQSEALEKP